jgi:GNAT superfamily N-acetyltransferase
VKDVDIRRATLEDRERLKVLVRAYIDFYEQPQPPDVQVDALLTLLAERDEIGVQFVAEENGGLIGFATIFLTYDTVAAARVAIMNDLFVTPAMRGMGIGRALIERCARFSRESGCVLLQWVTAADNTSAQALYDRVATRTSWVTYNVVIPLP